MMKKFFVLISLLLFFVTPVFSATWIQLGDKLYIDKDSISTYIDDYDSSKTEQKTFWIKQLNNGNYNFKKLEKTFNKKVWYVMYQWIVNTKNNTQSIKTTVCYDLKNGVIDYYTIPDFMLTWNRIVPDTLGELLYNLISDKNLLEKIYEAQLEKEK